MAEGVSFGEACFISDAEFRNSDDRDIFTPMPTMGQVELAARIRHFSQSVLSAEAWFRTADELIEAMDLVGRNVERFWEDFRSISVAVDNTSDTSSQHQTNDVPQKRQSGEVSPKYNLINQHMMLAGFAIENLCKGYLVGLLSRKEQEDIKAGTLPTTLRTHDIVALVQSTGMTFSNRENDLLQRIGKAIWRGRYPSPSDHKKISRFAQWEDDIGRIKTFLPKLRAHVGAKSS